MPELSPEEKADLRAADSFIQSVTAGLETTVIYVQSQTDPNVTYMVVRARYADDGSEIAPWYCTCPAFKYHEGQYPDSTAERKCKHIRKVEADDLKRMQ